MFSEVLRLRVKEKKSTGIQKALVSGGRQVLLPEPIYHFVSQEVMCCKALTLHSFLEVFIKGSLVADLHDEQGMDGTKAEIGTGGSCMENRR